ncbi:MAG: hypothetical protein R3E66_18880 [bacterium]
MRRRKHVLSLVMALMAVAAGCDNSDPGIPDSQPVYRWQQDGECSSGERGNMMINEINFAGSVRDDGTFDADDIFIELWNRHPRPINVSNWRLNVYGDTDGYVPDRGYLIPTVEAPMAANGYFVIAKKRDGAFKDVADVFIDDLELGKKFVELELRDCDQKLMEGAGSRDLPVFAGGFDLVTVRSMERAQLIFANGGGAPINWHSYSANTAPPSVAEGFRQRTLASPGEANSPDYSGAAAAGNFE